MTHKSNKSFLCSKHIYLFMLLSAIGLSLKYIFIDFCVDSEYQIAMAYRLANGDIMFKEMWEVHQTSAFLCAIFLKIYLLLFNTTTGVVLYLQFIGIVLDGALAYLIYTVIYKLFNKKDVAFAMAWVSFVVSPKDVPIAEFANMQVWFCTLLCIMMFLYHQTGKRRFILLAAWSLCGAVLSYPSCIILVFAIIFLFIRQDQKKDLLLFLGICVTTGLLYLYFLFKHITFSEFIYSIENMLALEPTHTISLIDKFFAYIADVGILAIVLALAYVFSYVIAIIICKNSKKDNEFTSILTSSLFFLIMLCISIYSVIKWQTYTRYTYSMLFITIIIIGLRYTNYLSADALYLYNCGTTISIFNFIATLLLTDLRFIDSIPYLLIAVIVAFLPISEMLRTVNNIFNTKKLFKALLLCGILFLVFRNIYIIKPFNSQIQPITAIRGIVKEGPAFGMISEYMGAYMQNESVKEWEQYVPNGSSIYLVGSSVNALGYLYSDTTIAAPSVMSTPWYNDCIPKYWTLNPDRYPDIVIVSCWYGELDPLLDKNTWIFKWIDEDFKPSHYVDGKYWRYYFK